jgi:hypothetical protein
VDEEGGELSLDLGKKKKKKKKEASGEPGVSLGRVVLRSGGLAPCATHRPFHAAGGIRAGGAVSREWWCCQQEPLSSHTARSGSHAPHLARHTRRSHAPAAQADDEAAAGEGGGGGEEGEDDDSFELSLKKKKKKKKVGGGGVARRGGGCMACPTRLPAGVVVSGADPRVTQQEKQQQHRHAMQPGVVVWSSRVHPSPQPRPSTTTNPTPAAAAAATHASCPPHTTPPPPPPPPPPPLQQQSRKDEFDLDDDPEAAAEAAERGDGEAGSSSGGKHAWSNTDREYTYDELLGE